MVWLPDGEKISKMFIRFGMIHERDRRTDRRTDRQTSHDGYSITRQKWLKKRGPGEQLDTLQMFTPRDQSSTLVKFVRAAEGYSWHQ